MSVRSLDIGRLVKALTGQPSVMRSGVQFAPMIEARFHEISPGTVTWDWCDRNPTEQDLGATFAYYDLDGKIVGVNVAKAGNQVTELELWRGDDRPILSVPQRSDLWEMMPGRVYPPRI